MAFIEANGATFYYETHGQGQPLVLIGGYGTSHLLWLPVLNALSQHYQVVIFDNRGGAGQTQDDGRELSIDLLADDVMALITTLDLQKPHIVGQSMGGSIAQSMAARYGDQLGKIVLLVTSAKWRQAVIIGLSIITRMMEDKMPIDDILANRAAWVYGEAFLSDPKKMALFKQAVLNDPHPQTLVDRKRQMVALEGFDGRKLLAAIKSETLVVYGEEDLLSLPGESKFLAEHIAGAKLLGFGTGHGVIVEEPQAFAKALIEFFA